MRQLWAALERIIARGSIAITSIAVAALTSPSEFGIYSWMALSLSLFQALIEVPIRQLAPSMMAVADQLRRFNKLRMWGTMFGVLSLTGVGLAIAASTTTGAKIPTWLALLPIVLAPVPIVASLRSVAALQISGRWHQVLKARTVSAMLGMIIGLTVAFLLRSFFGASLAIFVTESLLAVLVFRMARGLALGRPVSIEKTGESTSRSFTFFALYSSLGWFQGQLDRVLIGAFAGTASLGAYSLGSSVGRAAGDAVAASHANVLRIELQGKHGDRDISKTTAKSLPQATLFTAITVLFVLVAVKLVLAPVLGDQWWEALKMAPILALIGFPSLISWASGPIHSHRGKTKNAIWAPIVGIALVPFVPWVALTVSISAAAWVLVVRECVLAALQLLLMGKAAPWLAAAPLFAATLIGSVIVVLTM